VCVCVCGVVHEKVFKQFRFKEGDRVVFAEDDRHVGRVLADQSLVVRGQHSLLSLATNDSSCTVYCASFQLENDIDVTTI
jgi:hypothetical protein